MNNFDDDSNSLQISPSKEISVPLDEAEPYFNYESVEVRTKQWKDRVEERIQKVRDSKKDTELDGCTFHPQLVPRTKEGELGAYSKKSYEKYVNKMKMLRMDKEYKRKKETMKPGSGIV